jgi:uncharacterized protein (DUF1697 family)
MSRCVAFLRGVNLGAKRRVKSEQLRRAFEELGFEEVAPFRTSGNVVFGVAAKSDEESIVAKVEAGLREALGFDVQVVLRSGKEVAAIAAYAPFEPDAVAATEGRLQVVLMAKKPAASVRKQVLALATDRDRLAMRGRELYWLPSGGTRDSELDQEALGASLGLVTVRTKGTIEQIAAKHFDD